MRYWIIKECQTQRNFNRSLAWVGSTGAGLEICLKCKDLCECVCEVVGEVVEWGLEQMERIERQIGNLSYLSAIYLYPIFHDAIYLGASLVT